MPKRAQTALREKRAEIFADVYALTESPSKAMIAAEPELAAHPDYAKVKAQRVLKRSDVQEKIQKKLESMQKAALQNIKQTLTSDNEQLANANAWRIVEHVRGKPVARSINLNANAGIEDALFE